GVICLEMMKKITDGGFRIAEVPVHHYHRAYGKSQFFNFRRLYCTAIDVVKIWYSLVIRREHLKTPDALVHKNAGLVPRVLSRPKGARQRRARFHRQQP